jgi:hypothetical protein
MNAVNQVFHNVDNFLPLHLYDKHLKKTTLPQYTIQYYRNTLRTVPTPL